MMTTKRIKTLPGTIPVVTEILVAPKRLSNLRAAASKQILSASPDFASNPVTKYTP